MLRINDCSDVPHHVLEVPAWLMQWVNSGEWGDDLPPHPSPGDGRGKPVFDSCGGWRWFQGTDGVKHRDAGCGDVNVDTRVRD